MKQILITILLLGVVVRADEPVTPEQIAAAVKQLGADSFRDRRQAETFLWTHGDQAGAALEQAAKSDDPEVKLRANRILEKVRLGIFPNTPPTVAALIRRYREGDATVRVQVAGELIAMGDKGRPTLLRLLTQETNAQVRRDALRVVPANRKLAAGLVRGETSMAELKAMLGLRAAAGQDQEDYIAFLVLNENVEAEIRALEKSLAARPSDQTARLLAGLYRAAGKPDKASTVVRDANDRHLLELLLQEQGKYKELTKVSWRMFGKGIENLGYKAAYHRLAGNEEAYAEAVKEILAYSRERRENTWFAAEALLICGDVETALKVLQEGDRYQSAFKLLVAQFRVDEAMAVVRQAEAAGADSLPFLKVEQARLLGGNGKRRDAGAILQELLKTAFDADELPTHTRSVVNAMFDLGFAAEALGAMKQAGTKGLPPEDAAGWLPRSRRTVWELLVFADPGRGMAAQLTRLEKAVERLPAPAKLRRLIIAAAAGIAKLPADRQQRSLRRLTEICLESEELDLAAKYAAQVDRKQRSEYTRRIWLARADLQAAAGRWAAAAEAYRKAWDADPTRADALYLHGLALQHAGKRQAGQTAMDQAALLPLGSSAQRHQLAEALEQRGYREAALAHYELLLRVGRSGWSYNAALRRMGRHAEKEKKDYAGAYQYLLRCHLPCLQTSSAYMNAASYLHVPAGLHQIQARHRMQKNDAKGALAQARKAAFYSIHNADFYIDIIRDLDAAGSRQDADQLIAEVGKGWLQILKTFPDSAMAHNNFAWLYSRCRRNLEQALKHARAAVKLEPKTAAYLDTLAEVHFQLGDRDKAVAFEQQAAALQPGRKFFQDRIQEFKTKPLPKKRTEK